MDGQQPVDLIVSSSVRMRLEFLDTCVIPSARAIMPSSAFATAGSPRRCDG